MSAMLSLVFAGAGFVTTNVLGIYLACFTLNGIVQATGWPGNGKLMASWFSSARRAEVMGLWTTCYPAGGLVTNVVAGWLLGWGWRTVYVGMATWVLLVFIAGSSDRVYVWLNVSYTSQIEVYRVLVFVIPLLASAIAHRVCEELVAGEKVEADEHAAEAEARLART